MDKKLFQSYRSKEFLRISCVNQTYFVMSGGFCLLAVLAINQTTKQQNHQTTKQQTSFIPEILGSVDFLC